MVCQKSLYPEGINNNSRYLLEAKGRLLKNVFKGSDCFQAEGDSNATVFKLTALIFWTFQRI